MQPFRLDLNLLRRLVGAQLTAFEAGQIKTTFPWCRVFRVTLHMQGHPLPDSAVLKAIDPFGTPDPFHGRREYRFYQDIYPRLQAPKPRLLNLAIDDDSGWYVILLEDLSPRYRIPQHPYQWSRAELEAVLRAYAALHVSPLLPPESDRQWLTPRHESELDFDLIPEQAAAIQRMGIWGDLPELPDLIAYARESCVHYSTAHISLLHNDTAPTNVALPEDPHAQPAVLFDWQDAGVGMPEMDLAYLDLQPFHSGRAIPREELLASYWKSRACIHSEIPSQQERTRRQLHADIVMALWLTRPASRVALHPYPAGTYPRMHWDSHFGIIHDRMRQLGREIGRAS